MKRRPGRPSKQKKKANPSRYRCEECQKSFAWKKDLQRHALTHYSTHLYECDACERKFLRKDKLKDHMKTHEKQAMQLKEATNFTVSRQKEAHFAEHLYAALPLRRISCKLCEKEFPRSLALREHLSWHADASTLQTLNKQSQLIQQIFKQPSTNLQQEKQLICADISQGRLERYYAVVNDFGYELSLSDTDAEETAPLINRYTCELCQKKFARKRLMFEHVQNTHAQAKLPYKCNVCKLQFVCLPLFQQHMRTQCRNKEKKYQCLSCPGKFMWLENLQQHQCVNRFNIPEYKCKLRRQIQTTQKENERLFECCLCSARSTKLAQLRQHLQQHASGELSLEPNQARYFQLYKQADEHSIQLELQAARQLWRFYSAVDESGNEMHLSDSDSDNTANDNVAYQCSKCPTLEFQRRKYLLQHQQTAHVTDTLPFKCTQCHQGFIALALLKRHVQRDCATSNKMKIQCAYCSARFFWQANLELHVQRKHLEQQVSHNKLQCDTCGKVFIWPKDLVRHKRAHLPEIEKYACPFCARQFNRKDNMHAHLKVHGPEAVQQFYKKDANRNKPKIKGKIYF